MDKNAVIQKELDTEYGKLVLVYTGPDVDVENEIDRWRNVYLFDKDGKQLWQISTDFDDRARGDFTNIFYEEPWGWCAYRWIGYLYQIDMKTGKAEPKLLMK